MADADVLLWGRRIGAVSWDFTRSVGIFQFDPAFLATGIELSPFVMPVRETPYSFLALSPETFNGLPGLLADALPDAFGNTLIDVWLAETGRKLDDFTPVDRLCYMGTRAVGALEFRPALPVAERNNEIEIAELVDLANRILDDRTALAGKLSGADDKEALENILSVGTSAGGARAKAVLAWNPKTREFRSGQVNAEEGFEHWILKFDGVSNNRDRGLLVDSQGYGRIEYAYFLMARMAGIQMNECRLHHESGRSHFMTRRFDRDMNGRKIHMQTLGALRHFDYNLPNAYAYEQVMQTIREMKLGMSVVEEQFRRTVFNIVARNQDDHVKNISFLMNQKGDWQLSPAYDMTYAYNPSGLWTRDHQMSILGKRNNFKINDVLRFAESSGIRKFVARRILDKIVDTVSDWPIFAIEAGVEKSDVQRIQRTHRTMLAG